MHPALFMQAVCPPVREEGRELGAQKQPKTLLCRGRGGGLHQLPDPAAFSPSPYVGDLVDPKCPGSRNFINFIFWAKTTSQS